MAGVLVLGAGQVGTFAARAIADEGIHVTAADRQPSAAYFRRYGPRNGATLATADILDVASVSAIMRTNSFETVVLSAGLTRTSPVPGSQTAWEVNVNGAEAVAKIALTAGLKRLVFISSFAVYGQPPVGSIAETVSLQPQSAYGRAKAAAENAIASFRHKGLDVRILRLCGIYGPVPPGQGSRSAQFVDSMLAYALTGRELTIRASPASADEYLYVKDMGRAIALAALRDVDSPEFVFNVGPGERTTIHELCRVLQRTLGARISIEIMRTHRQRPMAPLNVSRIRRVLGFEPDYGLTAGLGDYLSETSLHTDRSA